MSWTVARDLGDLVSLKDDSADEATPHPWVQVALTGEWKGHPRPFVVTLAHLQQMEANFATYTGGRLLFDYDHQTLRSKDNGQPALASGWGTAARVTELSDGRHALEVRVEWTQAAAKSIRAREYRFLSPVYLFDRVDKKTGTPIGMVLHSVALTNSPFLDELPPVAATDPASEPSPMSTLLPALLPLLALSATASEAQVIDRVRSLNDSALNLRANLGLALNASDSDVAAAIEGLRSKAAVGEVALSHLPAGTTAETALTVLPPALGHAGYVALSDHEAVKTELAELRADRLLAEAESEGKVSQAQRDWFRKYALSDIDTATQWLKAAPKVFPGSAKDRTGPKLEDGGHVALTDVQRSVAHQLGLSEDEYAKQLAEDAAAS